MSKSINNIFVFKPTPSINHQGNIKRPHVETLTVNHLKPIFNDKNPQACFDNAIKKKVFTEKEVLSDNYIMYMCSDNNFDYFKSKLTKTKYQVKRSNV